MTKTTPQTQKPTAATTGAPPAAGRPPMKYGLAFKTAGSAGQIGDLLEQHCNGQWHIILCDLETENGVKELKVMFELEADKNAFKRVVTGEGDRRAKAA